jgi:TatA/E family protein of Tat protein translocase
VSFLDTLVIVIVVFLVFGPDKVPEVARSIGRGMRDFRKAMADLEKGVEEHTEPVRKELSDISESTKATVAEANTAVTLARSEVVAADTSLKSPLAEASREAEHAEERPPQITQPASAPAAANPGPVVPQPPPAPPQTPPQSKNLTLFP